MPMTQQLLLGSQSLNNVIRIAVERKNTGLGSLIVAAPDVLEDGRQLQRGELYPLWPRPTALADGCVDLIETQVDIVRSKGR